MNKTHPYVRSSFLEEKSGCCAEGGAPQLLWDLSEIWLPGARLPFGWSPHGALCQMLLISPRYFAPCRLILPHQAEIIQHLKPGVSQLRMIAATQTNKRRSEAPVDRQTLLDLLEGVEKSLGLKQVHKFDFAIQDFFLTLAFARSQRIGLLSL